MIKFKLFNTKSFARAIIVAAGAGMLGTVFSLLLSNLLDELYRFSNSDFVYTLYYTLSRLQGVVITILWLAILALFSNWIFYPSFLSYSRTVAQSIQLDEATTAPELPKQFVELQRELEKTHKDLQLWKYAMQEAEKRKDELVVYLAHDIRTPLTSVLGYLELLDENPELPAKNREQFTATALRKAQRMKTLVEELFEVTRFNISHIELHKEPLNAGIMLRQLTEEMMPVLEERQLAIAVDIPENTYLFADSDKISRVLDNVLHNAAYYAPTHGKLWVRCYNQDQNTIVQISNQGAEISQAELNRYFEKFYRGDEARQTTTGGSGLGLAIAKHIVEAHGGSITAQNQNLVTTFTITLPQQAHIA